MSDTTNIRVWWDARCPVQSLAQPLWNIGTPHRWYPFHPAIFFGLSDAGLTGLRVI